MRGKAYGILLLWGVLCLSAQADVVDAVIDGKSAGYRFLETSEKPWRLCASLPQARDRFFWAVAWGLVEQSKRLGATIGIYQAGGYEHLDVQKQQIESCIKDGADAVLIAAIDPQALAAEQEALTKKGIVIIDLINGLDGNNIAAHSLPPVTDAGRLLAEYILELSKGAHWRVAWFPGPLGAHWSMDYDRAIRKILGPASRKGRSIELIEGGWAPSDITTQASLIRQFADHQTADVILANGPAAEFAARFYASRPGAPKYIISLYPTEGVVEGMQQGGIAAMAGIAPLLQARIAIDLAVRALEHRASPKLVNVPTQVITRVSLAAYASDNAVAPSGERIPLPRLVTPAAAFKNGL